MLSKNHIVVIFILAIIFLSQTAGYALANSSSQLQPPFMMSEQEATLSGYVTDTLMNPLNGALVRVYFHGTYEENYSNSMGYYQVTHIPLCYCLKNATCSMPGYQPQWVLLSISENTTYDFILTSLNQTCYPVFNGTMGTGGWYISCVNVSFVINGDIDAVFYKVDGGLWTQYVESFKICESGLHAFYWYYVYQSNASETQSISLLIDRDYPELHLSSARISINRIKISAETTDDISGISRVEFVVDGVLWYVDYTLPYESVIDGIGIHHVKAVTFDNAGNSVNSTLITSLGYLNLSHNLLSFLFRYFFHQCIRPL